MYLLLITRICHVRDIYMRNLLGFNPRLTASVQNKKKYIFTNTENIVRHSINNILVIVYHTIFIVFSHILSCQSYVFYKFFFVLHTRLTLVVWDRARVQITRRINNAPFSATLFSLTFWLHHMYCRNKSIISRSIRITVRFLPFRLLAHLK